jgi:hypothetical protein
MHDLQAIHFIPRHKLGHTFFKQLGMSESLDRCLVGAHVFLLLLVMMLIVTLLQLQVVHK